MKEGKLPPEVLERLLTRTSRSSLLRVGARTGEDAAVAAGWETLVVTADPVTFTEENIGVYTVAVNANDVVATGGRPMYLTTTVLLPPGIAESRLEGLFEEIGDAARVAGLLWIGGHTEVTSAVTRIVVSGQCIGFLFGKPLLSSGARPGDTVCVTKWIALEGTTTVARLRPQDSRRILGERRHAEVIEWLTRPGISIVPEGRILEGQGLSSGHDPTEGGLAMGLAELAQRSGVGIRIRREELPVREETRLLCARFGLDPLGLLSSGVFLFTAPPEAARKACRLVREAGIPATAIGEVREGPAAVEIDDGKGGWDALPADARDQIVKLTEAGG